MQITDMIARNNQDIKENKHTCNFAEFSFYPTDAHSVPNFQVVANIRRIHVCLHQGQ